MTKFLGEAQSSTRARALKGVALSAVALAMVAPGYAQAQQQAGDVQEVTITGSRIKAPNLTSDSPITAVSSEEIKAEGTTNVETMLNNLPSVVGDATNIGYAAGGFANVDLRGLGPSRNLVLIDGQRIGPSTPTVPAADLNFIPAALVESVEVLTGGASAVYGSDAMSGVINFHMLKNLDGALLDYTFSGFQHDNNNARVQAINDRGVGGVPGNPNPGTVKYDKGSRFDGFVRDTTAAFGVNSADKKGNVMLYAEYRSTAQLLGPKRDTSACALAHSSSYDFTSPITCGGSSTGPWGRFSPPKAVLKANGLPSSLKVADNHDGSRTFVAFGGDSKFNFASTSFLQAGDDRTIVGASGHYQINSHVELYARMQLLHDSNLSQIGPDPIVGSGSATPPFLTVQLPCSALGTAPSPDPKLKGLSQQQLMGCTSSSGLTPLVTVPGIREQLPREADSQTYHYLAVAGLRGDINDAWTYDTSFAANIENQTVSAINYPTATNYARALANQTFDIYQYNPGLQAQQERNLAAIGIDAPRTSDYDIISSVTGDLGSYGATSPWASNGVMTALGVEYREARVTDSPDSLLVTGALIGGPTVHVFSGREATTEGFGELRIPIIEHKPFAETLNLNLAARHSETQVTNTPNSFSANTWKVNADYSPEHEIRFRGGYNRADRAPGVYELFRPVALTGLGGGHDPCATGTASAATCSNPALPFGAQVPTSAYGSVTDCNASQCNLSVGGNTALKPEVAHTWTWGVNLTPDFLPGLNASVDYWDIKIDKYIGSLNANSILQGCYTSQPGYCQYIHRDGTGVAHGIDYGAPGSTTAYSLDGSSAGGIEDFNTNLANLHTKGLDFDLNYRRNIADVIPGADNMGSIAVAFLGTYVMQNSVQNNNSVLAYDCVGFYGASCGTPQAAWRHTMRVTWNTPWNVDFSVNWRHIGGVLLDSNQSPTHNFPDYQLGPNGFGYDAFDAKIPAYDYLDLSVSYTLWDKYSVRVGVNNVMDKDPPIVTSEATGGTAAFVGQTINGFSQYDSLGRNIFMNFNAKF